MKTTEEKAQRLINELGTNLKKMNKEIMEQFKFIYPKSSGEQILLERALEAKDKAYKEALKTLLEKGHGGGNWRRLILQMID